mmetsp:Transcript_21063/g.31650  ORF Transcript_21063/g.31650 Transcript_21063/m.31650 type:complete len:166 (-) Transcript_21063:129-626(-)
MKAFLFLLIAPLFVALPTLACSDDSKVRWKNGEFTLSCAFLTNNPAKKAQRTNNWCDKKVKDIKTKDQFVVKKKCKKACKNCGSDDGGNGNDCTDNPHYTFGTYTYEGKRITRTCHWISSVDEIAKQRRNNWCNRVMNGVKVKKECPATCFVCKGPEVDSPVMTE